LIRLSTKSGEAQLSTLIRFDSPLTTVNELWAATKIFW
jgi:hypothetical protein